MKLGASAPGADLGLNMKIGVQTSRVQCELADAYMYVVLPEFG